MLVQIQNPQNARVAAGSDRAEDFHLFETDFGHHLLLVNGSRVYNIPEDLAQALGAARLDAPDLLDSYGLSAPPYIDDRPVQNPELRAVSLAIAQVCNLGCTYCYAQQGSFGAE